VADQEIDRLLLEIEVEDKTQGGSKKLVEDFATAISKLQAEINKLDTSKLEAVSKALSFSGAGGGGAKGTSAVGKQSEEVKKLNSELKNLQKTRENILKQNVLSGSTLGEVLGAKYTDKEGKTSVISEEAAAQLYEQFGLSEIDKQIAEVQSKLSQVQIPQAQGGTTEQLQQIENVTKAVDKELELNTLRDVQKAQLNAINEKLKDQNLSEEEYIKLKKQALSLEKAMKGTGEKNLLSAIKRVAIYRAIRGALKAITNAFKEGFGNLAQFSDEVNQKVSQLTSSFAIIKNSVAVAFLPLLNAITPIIQKIAVVIANLANSISYLSAKLKGNATYLKVNTDYLKKFNEQSRLLSFDTFEKLQGGDDVSDMFKEVETASGYDNEELAKSFALLGGIATIVGVIGGSKIVQLLTSGVISKGLKAIVGSIKSINLEMVAWVAGLVLLIAGIVDLVASWNDINFEPWEKATTILLAIAGGVVGVYVALTALKATLPVAIAMGMALAGAIALIGTEVGKKSPKNYAFGGDYSSADLFYANENGQTELIASTNSGGGAVMNMQQLESAIYSGMVKAMASGENGESAIYLDGNKVGTFIAGNNGFRSEANRRNTGLNWR
jgi:hypothetical protein